MWTRGRDKDQPGSFAFELFSPDGVMVERVGGFATHTAADRAAEAAQRRLTPIGECPAADLPEMTDDELLAALFD